jgi:eukaryotic-like serine/threonine-protein kinase
MTTDRWQQINDIFQSATECAPEERVSFLAAACHGDEGLHRQVTSLIASFERAENFIESPAFEDVPELLTDDRGDALIGELIGHYRIESFIGAGGMGEVYRARDERLGRKVALKLLRERLTADETELSRFKAEARMASALNHPNIVTVHDIGALGNRQFIATEFIEGTTLRASLARGRMDLHGALEIAVQVASALAAAHETGIVHRDIKPENIMLRPDGYTKVLDFGVAKLSERRQASDNPDIARTSHETGGRIVIGTARYMSPEQARGTTVDARSDIWSLGVVIYEMITGIPLFARPTSSDCIASILKMEPTPLSSALEDVPVKVQSILQKALRKNRDERYQTSRELLADLRDFKRELEISSKQIKAPDGLFVSTIKRHKRGTLLTVAAGILAGVGLAYSFYRSAPMRLPNEKSIAVLPFVDLSPARDQEYFCDGIQEEILTRLSKVADLKVISRTSTQRFKGAADNVPQIGRQLRVAHILEGTVQRAGDQVRVHVQLIKAENDSHLWSEKYDRQLTDIFAVESEIAANIAAVLHAKLTGAEQRAIATHPTQNTEAHQLYLKGMFFFNKRTAADLRTAIEYFEAAIGKDPNYALAHAGMAGAYTILSILGGESPTLTVSKAKAAATKAIELDNTLAEAHNSLGLVLAYYEFDFAQSKREFERAIELNPNYAEAHHQLGNANLTKVGKFDRAIAEGARALELDPLSLIINSDLGQNYLMARRYKEAIEQSRTTLELDPRFYCAHWNLAEALQLNGQLHEAIAAYEKTVELTDDPTALAMLAQSYAKNGQTDKALNLFDELQQISADRYVGAISFAFVHLALGENEKALEEIERACREPIDPDVINLKIEPLLDPLRGDPRFERLVAKILGMADNELPGENN